MRINYYNANYVLGEKAQALFGTAISLPLIAIMLLSVGGAFFGLTKFYYKTLADAELSEEITSAFVRVVEDVEEAENVVWIPSEKKVRIIKRTNGSKKEERIYFLTAQRAGKNKLVEGAARNPMTGESLRSKVYVTDFLCEKVAGKKGLVRIELVGVSDVTFHSYRLFTEVYLPNMK